MDLELPIILLLTIVAPIAIIGHYITEWRTQRGLSAEDEASMDRLRSDADKLEQRLRSMERILDDEVPDWRQRSHEQI